MKSTEKVGGKEEKEKEVGITNLTVSGPEMVELYGHVIMVEGYALPNFLGCHALIALRDPPRNTVAVCTPEHRLQTLLETALSTGNLIVFFGQRTKNPPTPRGGTWIVDVYAIDGVILYDDP